MWCDVSSINELVKAVVNVELAKIATAKSTSAPARKELPGKAQLAEMVMMNKKSFAYVLGFEVAQQTKPLTKKANLGALLKGLASSFGKGRMLQRGTQAITGSIPGASKVLTPKVTRAVGRLSSPTSTGADDLARTLGSTLERVKGNYARLNQSGAQPESMGELFKQLWQ